MNIHRTPFSGRNFEYYSEDALLSGKMGAAMVRGCNEKNVYTYIKHFALNDQETNAIGGANWCNEQAMREIYLKPFELSVKEGESKAIMTTWSRIGATWAGASKPLLQNVLRDEWGFEGFVITDNAMMGDFQNADQAIAAGNDMMLSSTQRRSPSMRQRRPSAHEKSLSQHFICSCKQQCAGTCKSGSSGMDLRICCI